MKLIYLTFFLLAGLSLLQSCSSDAPSRVVGILQWERLELSNELNEKIIHLAVQEGDRVIKGQAIIIFDQRRMDADVENAQAVVAQLQARLDELLKGPRAEDIQQAKALYQQARSEQQLARTELKRIKVLSKQKLMSPDDLDRAAARLQSASAQLAAKQAALALLEQGTRPETIEQARQALAAAKAKLKRLQIAVEQLTIRAPRAGVVDELPFKEGEKPLPGSTVAVMLVGERPYASVYVPEPMRAKLHIGSKARIWLDGIESVFNGRIRSLSRDPVFTPYYSLTAGDRSRLAYQAKIDLLDKMSTELPAGIPLEARFDVLDSGGDVH